MPDQSNYILTLVAYDPATGEITNTFTADDVEFCEANALANGCTHWIFTSENVDTQQMWVQNGALVERPARAVERVSKIYPRQFFIALAMPPWELITPDEAVEAAVKGTMPVSVETIVATLPLLQQMQARITWSRMQEIQRTDSLVPLIAAARPDMTEEMIDEFFAFAATL